MEWERSLSTFTKGVWTLSRVYSGKSFFCCHACGEVGCLYRRDWSWKTNWTNYQMVNQTLEQSEKNHEITTGGWANEESDPHLFLYHGLRQMYIMRVNYDLNRVGQRSNPFIVKLSPVHSFSSYWQEYNLWPIVCWGFRVLIYHLKVLLVVVALLATACSSCTSNRQYKKPKTPSREKMT